MWPCNKRGDVQRGDVQRGDVQRGDVQRGGPYGEKNTFMLVGLSGVLFPIRTASLHITPYSHHTGHYEIILSCLRVKNID